MSEQLAPFDAGQIVARLRDQLPELRDVGEAADLAAILERSPNLPAAFVVVESETHDSSLYAEHGELAASVTVAVIYGVRHFRTGERGAANAVQARPLIGAGRAALIGWTPTVPAGVTAEPIRIQGRAALLRYDQADYWWADRFLCKTETTT